MLTLKFFLLNIQAIKEEPKIQKNLENLKIILKFKNYFIKVIFTIIASNPKDINPTDILSLFSESRYAQLLIPK